MRNGRHESIILCCSLLLAANGCVLDTSARQTLVDAGNRASQPAPAGEAPASPVVSLPPVPSMPPLHYADGGTGMAEVMTGVIDASVSTAPTGRAPDAGPVTTVNTGPVDAGVPAMPTRMQAVDAGAADAMAPRPRPDASAMGQSCEGSSVFDMCWYLGAAAVSCTDACRSHGGPDARAARIVGTSRQGGSLEGCATVLRALGQSAPLGPSMNELGVGCHVWADGKSYWLDEPSPDFSPTASGAPERVRIACACAR